MKIKGYAAALSACRGRVSVVPLTSTRGQQSACIISSGMDDIMKAIF